jgi:hypothetical protein
MFTHQGQDGGRAVARALTTRHSGATARVFRPVRSVLAAVAVAAAALVAAAAFGGAASAATRHPAHPAAMPATHHRGAAARRPATTVTGLTWHPLTLINGWQSDQGQFDSGNPAWAVKNGIVYLSGSLHQPGGTPLSNSEFAVLPAAARPAHQLDVTVYTDGGTFGALAIGTNGMYVHSPVVADGQAYSSLAGVSFPAATTAMHTLSLLNSWAGGAFGGGDPADTVTGGVVHLSGSLSQPSSGTNDEFAVLPAAARPAHTLYLNVNTIGNSTGVLEIDPSGVMHAYQGGAQSFTSLAGVSFPAATTATQPLSLLNGWQSGQSAFGTGDPAYTVTGGVVHLSGSLHQPSGTGEEFTVLPPAARPAHDLWIMTYTADGAVGALEIMTDGEVDAFNNTGNAAQQYTSLAAIAYPINS